MTNSFKLSLLTIGMLLVPAQSFGMAAFASKWASQAISRYQAAQDEATKARLELVRLQKEAAIKAEEDRLEAIRLQQIAYDKARYQELYPVEAEFYRRGNTPFVFDKSDFYNDYKNHLNNEVYDYYVYNSEPKTFFVGKKTYPHSGQYKIGMRRANGNYTICGFDGSDTQPITYESYDKEIGWFGGSSVNTMRALIKDSNKDSAPYQKCLELAKFLKNTRLAAQINNATQQ